MKLIRGLLKIWFYIRVPWSNFIYRKDLVQHELQGKDLINRTNFLNTLNNIVRNVYRNFCYTYDDIAVLFDAMHKPAQAYYDYMHNNFYDDCDGYHAAIYHILSMNDYTSFLLTYLPTDIKQAHTVCYFIGDDNRYYLVDYKRIYVGETIHECLAELADDRKIEICFYNTVVFDYEANKYRIVSWG